jgi:hypothetical protein
MGSSISSLAHAASPWAHVVFAATSAGKEHLGLARHDETPVTWTATADQVELQILDLDQDEDHDEPLDLTIWTETSVSEIIQALDGPKMTFIQGRQRDAPMYWGIPKDSSIRDEVEEYLQSTKDVHRFWAISWVDIDPVPGDNIICWLQGRIISRRWEEIAPPMGLV